MTSLVFLGLGGFGWLAGLGGFVFLLSAVVVRKKCLRVRMQGRSRRSAGVTGGKAECLARRDACILHCYFSLQKNDFCPSHKELIIVLSCLAGRITLQN